MMQALQLRSLGGGSQRVPQLLGPERRDPKPAGELTAHVAGPVGGEPVLALPAVLWVKLMKRAVGGVVAGDEVLLDGLARPVGHGDHPLPVALADHPHVPWVPVLDVEAERLSD